MSKHKKIAITGTHSTGKTTIAKKVEEKFNIPYIRGDKAIKICSDLFPKKEIDKLPTVKHWILQQEMFQSFDDVLNYKGECVTDGFHLTCIPYGLMYTDLDILNISGFDEFTRKVYQKSHLFDHIFYLPPEIGLEDDGFRPKSESLRLDIDSMMIKLLKTYDYRIISGSIDERANQIGEILGLSTNPMKNYIALEGLPRSGKTTQLKKLQEIPGVYICNRNQSKYMKEFKKIRKENWYANSKEVIELNVEALLYDLNQNNVLERLAEGQIVVSDRQKFTILSMFGALGVSMAELYKATYKIPTPGKVIYINIEPELSVKRSIDTKQSSKLKSDVNFQKEVKRVYSDMSKGFDFHLIDGNKNIENIHQEMLNIMRGIE